MGGLLGLTLTIFLPSETGLNQEETNIRRQPDGPSPLLPLLPGHSAQKHMETAALPSLSASTKPMHKLRVFRRKWARRWSAR